MPTPTRGEIWWANLDPVVGHEQAGSRPVLIISADTYNRGPLGLVVVVPMTQRIRAYPLHVAVEPSQSGLRDPGAIMCDQPRVLCKQRLLGTRRAGKLDAEIMVEVEYLLKTVMALP